MKISQNDTLRAVLKTGLRAFVAIIVLSAVLYPDKFLANPTQRVFMGFVWSMILAVIVYFYFKRKYDR